MSNTKNPVSRILSLLRLEKAEISAIYFYAILNGLIQLSLPLGVQAIVGYVMAASMRASLVVLIALIVLGVLMSGIMQINQMKVIEKIQQKIFVRYSFAFADHLPALDLKKNDATYLPELINRFFDVPILQKSLAKILIDIPTAVIQIIFGLLLLTLYHPAFILFGLLLVLTLFLILRYTGGKGLKTSLEKSKYKYRVAAWLEEMARVVKSVKLGKISELHLQKADAEVSNYLRARNKHFDVLLLQFNVLVAFKTVITAGMLIVGTLLMVNQQLSVGQFVAAEIVILLVINSVEKLIINLANVYDTLTATEKASEITDKAIEQSGSVQATKTAGGMKLEMKDVSFGYDEESLVLKDINFEILPNQKVCISGKDSSGKTTLLKLMTGSYTDFSGSILIDDIPLSNYQLESLRENIGVALSQQAIFQGTVLENITLGNKGISIDSIKDLVRKIGLVDFVNSLQEGYDTMLDPAGKRLPRNVAQRILLVRALAQQPRLLLLEEPWMHANPENQKQIMEMLLQLKTTVVVVCNDPEFARQCDQQLILNENGTQQNPLV